MKKHLRFLFLFFVPFIFVSCEADYEGVGDDTPDADPVVKSITLSISEASLAVGQEITFQVLSDKNNIITSSCKFFVNGTEISGNKFKPGEPGEYSVNATYKELTSNTESFVATATELKDFKFNVLIEDFTGAWCGYCTRVTYKLEQLKKTTSQLNVVAAHYGDALQYSKISEMTNAFGVSSYPHARLNRTTKWNETDAAVTSLFSTKAKAGVALESSISGSTLTVKFQAKFSETGTDMLYGLFLLEDDLLLDQRNYGDFGYGSADPLVDFKHEDVLRYSFTSPLGDNIPNDSSKAGSIFEKTLTYELPAAYDKENLKLVGFVTDGSKKSLNSRISDIGLTQTFEEL